MVATVGEFQMPARVGRAEDAAAIIIRKIEAGARTISYLTFGRARSGTTA